MPLLHTAHLTKFSFLACSTLNVLWNLCLFVTSEQYVSLPSKENVFLLRLWNSLSAWFQFCTSKRQIKIPLTLNWLILSGSNCQFFYHAYSPWPISLFIRHLQHSFANDINFTGTSNKKFHQKRSYAPNTPFQVMVVITKPVCLYKGVIINHGLWK